MRPLLALCLVLAGCAELKGAEPTSDQAPNEPAPAAVPKANVDTICAPYCDWRDRCPSDTSPSRGECLSRCRDEWSGRAPHLNAAYVSYVSACFPALSCQGIDDSCFNNFVAVDPKLTTIPELNQCLAARNACSHLSSADCYFLAGLNSATRTATTACFAGACDDVDACVKHARGD